MRRTDTRIMVGLVALVVICLLTPTLVRAQTSTGAVAGNATDGKAPLPGVTMTVNNAATGFTRTTVTDTDGNFRFAALPVGKYSVKAELSGFATVKVEGVQVDVATTRTIEVTMKESKVAEQVTVTAEAPLVETSPAIGTVVSQNELQTLPLNGRQFANLGVLAPGTMLGYNTDPTKPNQLVVELNGGSGRNVNYLIDGGDNTDDTIGGALQNFNLESVQEFKIQTMQYKAEYGRSSGGVLTVITKTGTNQFAGSVWEFARRKGLNSETESEKLSNSGKADYTRDQYGASFGGPIVKDKVHFFVTYEKTKIAQSYVVDPGTGTDDPTLAAALARHVPGPRRQVGPHPLRRRSGHRKGDLGRQPGELPPGALRVPEERHQVRPELAGRTDEPRNRHQQVLLDPRRLPVFHTEAHMRAYSEIASRGFRVT